MDDSSGSPPAVTPPVWQRVGWSLTMIALVLSAVLLAGSTWEILAFTAVIISFVLVAWFAKRQAGRRARRDIPRRPPARG